MSAARLVQVPFLTTPELLEFISGDQTIKVACELLRKAPLFTPPEDETGQNGETVIEDTEWPSEIAFKHPSIQAVFSSLPAIHDFNVKASVSPESRRLTDAAISRGSYIDPRGDITRGTDILYKKLSPDPDANWLPISVQEWLHNIRRPLSNLSASALIRVHPQSHSANGVAEESILQVVDFANIAQLASSIADIPPRDSWTMTMDDDAEANQFSITYECRWNLGDQRYKLGTWDPSRDVSLVPMDTDGSDDEPDDEMDLKTSLVISGSLRFDYSGKDMAETRQEPSAVPTSSSAAASLASIA